MKCMWFRLWFHSEEVLSNAALIAVGNISCDVNVNVDDYFLEGPKIPVDLFCFVFECRVWAHRGYPARTVPHSCGYR